MLSGRPSRKKLGRFAASIRASALLAGDPPRFYSHGKRVVAYLRSARLLRAPAQANSASAPGTERAFVDELDPGSFKGGHDLGQTFYHTADGAVACFHALNGWKRYPRCLRERFLFHTRQGSSRLQLGCGEQCRSPTQILNIILDLQLMLQPSKLESPAYSLRRSPSSRSLNTTGSMNTSSSTTKSVRFLE